MYDAINRGLRRASGEILAYLNCDEQYLPGALQEVAAFFEKHPELFFDGRHWDAPYSVLDYGDAAATEEARLQVVRYYSSLLTDALWLGEHDPNELSEASRARLLRAALALELLAGNEETEDET